MKKRQPQFECSFFYIPSRIPQKLLVISKKYRWKIGTIPKLFINFLDNYLKFF